MASPTPGTATTYGRGGQVEGVVVSSRHPDGARVEVHIVVEQVSSLPALAARVRQAVVEALMGAAPERAPWVVDVHVVDLVGVVDPVGVGERRLR